MTQEGAHAIGRSTWICFLLLVPLRMKLPAMCNVPNQGLHTVDAPLTPQTDTKNAFKFSQRSIFSSNRQYMAQGLLHFRTTHIIGVHRPDKTMEARIGAQARRRHHHRRLACVKSCK